MSTQYLTGALLSVLGAFVIVVSQAVTPPVLAWVAFGIAVAVVVITLLAQLDRSRGSVQRALDATTVIVSGLLIVFSIAANGAVVTWSSFAFSLGIVALAYAGLTVHEVTARRSHLYATNADNSMKTTPQARAA